MRGVFVTTDPRTHQALQDATQAMLDAIVAGAAIPGPRSPMSTQDLKEAVQRIELCPDQPTPIEDVLDELKPVFEGGIRLGDPNTVAHLHPAAAIPAAVAELAIGVTNQSMDAFDASPAATF